MIKEGEDAHFKELTSKFIDLNTISDRLKQYISSLSEEQKKLFDEQIQIRRISEQQFK